MAEGCPHEAALRELLAALRALPPDEAEFVLSVPLHDDAGWHWSKEATRARLALVAAERAVAGGPR